MKRLEGKIALVTGAGQGLGLCIAAKLRDEGAVVIATDIAQEPAAFATKAIDVRFFQHDVRSEERWHNIVNEVKKIHGRLDILVNNAGTDGADGLPKDPEHTTSDDWNFVFEVNTLGTFLGCKHAVSLMVKSGGGSIINLSSVASLVPTPFLTAYGASKAAVQQMTRSIALYCGQQGYQIRCNSIHPGQVRTPMLDRLLVKMSEEQGVDIDELVADHIKKHVPLGSLQQPSDIANLSLFLASDESRYITGQAIACDGGYTLTA